MVRAKGIQLLLPLLAVVLCFCQSQPAIPRPADKGEALPTPAIRGSVEYDVRETLTLVNEGPGRPAKQNVWMALIRDVPPYQTVLSAVITPDDYQEVTDEYGNRYAEFDLSDMAAGTAVTIELSYRIAIHEPVYDLGDCTGEMPAEHTQAELHVESNNPQIIELSRELSAGKRTACQKTRAFYDYVGNRLVHSYNSADWGAQAALGEMGADCTEYASLMMALSRAAGIPARYLEGLWASEEAAQGDGRTEHAWLEVYLPGAGWVPMDPTLGRSSVGREKCFAHLQPDHIVVTVGRNPSTLRGASYWTHLYWPGQSTEIRVAGFEWAVSRVRE